MNFFQRQHHVRKLSRRLVVLFTVAVLAIVAVVDLVAVVAFGVTSRGAENILTVIIWVSALTIAGIAVTSFARTKMLRAGGGGRVAQQLGGVHVPENTTDPRLRRLRNVVEEMAIAAGRVRAGDLRAARGEPGINAFAAGYSPPTRRSRSPTARWNGSTATSCRA